MNRNETKRRQYFAHYVYGNDTPTAYIRYAEPGDPIPAEGWERIALQDAKWCASCARTKARYGSPDWLRFAEIIPFRGRDFYDHTRVTPGAAFRITSTRYGADLLGRAGIIQVVEMDGFGETLVRLADEQNNRFSLTFTLDEIAPI